MTHLTVYLLCRFGNFNTRIFCYATPGIYIYSDRYAFDKNTKKGRIKRKEWEKREIGGKKEGNYLYFVSRFLIGPWTSKKIRGWGRFFWVAIIYTTLCNMNIQLNLISLFFKNKSLTLIYI